MHGSRTEAKRHRHTDQVSMAFGGLSDSTGPSECDPCRRSQRRDASGVLIAQHLHEPRRVYRALAPTADSA